MSLDSVNSNAELKSILSFSAVGGEKNASLTAKIFTPNELTLRDMFHYLAQQEGNTGVAPQTSPGFCLNFMWFCHFFFYALARIYTGSQRDTPLVDDYFYRQ